PFEVDVFVRVAIARQKLFDAKRARGVNRPDEHDISGPQLDQLDAAEDEGAHQDLAEVGVGLHEGQQMFAIQFDHFARLGGARAEQGAPARQHGGLAAELPGSKDHDETFGVAGWPHNLDFAALDHEERDGLVADLDEHFSALDRPYAAARGDPRDLRWGQHRKYVVVARLDYEWSWGRGFG